MEPSSAKRTRFAKRTAPDLPAVTEAEVSDVNDTDLSYAKSMFEWCSGQLDKLGRKTEHEWDVQKKRLQDHQSLKMTLFFRVKDIQAELVNASVTLKKLQTELQGDFEIKDGMLTQYNAVAESITKHTKEKLDFELKIIQTKQEIKNMKDDLEKIERKMVDEEVKHTRVKKAFKAFNTLVAQNKSPKHRCGECVIQCGRPATHVMPRCGHVCCCAECVDQLMLQPVPSCPYCRIEFDGCTPVKVHFPTL